MLSLSSLSAFSQLAAATRAASMPLTQVAARDAAVRAPPSPGVSAAPPVTPGRPAPRGSLLNLSV